MADSHISNVNHNGLIGAENPYNNNAQYGHSYKMSENNPYLQTNVSNNFVGDYNQTYMYTPAQTGQQTQYHQNQAVQYHSLQVEQPMQYQAVQTNQYQNNYDQYELNQMLYGDAMSNEKVKQSLNPEYYTYTDPKLTNQNYSYQVHQGADNTQVNSQNNYSKIDTSYATNYKNAEERATQNHEYKTQEKSEGSDSLSRRSRSPYASSNRRNRSSSSYSRSRSHRRTHRSRSRSHRSKRRHRRRYRSRSRSRRRSRSYDRHSRRRHHSSRHRSQERYSHRSRHDSRSPARRSHRSPERRTSRDRSDNSRNRSRSYDRRQRISERDQRSYERQSDHKDSVETTAHEDRAAGEVGVDVLEKARLLRSSEIEKRRQRDIEEAQRDDLTVLVFNMNLSVDERDIYELFSEHAGKVRDIQCVRDSRSGRSKGIAYVEFYTQESVIKALSMNGMPLKGQGIRVQSSQAEKNRAARAAKQLQENALKEADNPTTIMVSNLIGVLSNLCEPDLQQLFAPFGNVAEVAVARNDMGLSKGYAYIRFKKWTEAREALNVMNGFDISGQSIKVSYVTSNKNKGGKGSRLNELGDLDIERLDDEEAGLISGSSNKIALMKKLQQRVNSSNLMLSNMYTDEDYGGNNEFFDEIEEDVREECKKYGEVIKVYLNRSKPDGKVYIKFKTSTDAQTAHKALQGRYFAGNTIQVGYITDDQFNSLLGS